MTTTYFGMGADGMRLCMGCMTTVCDGPMPPMGPGGLTRNGGMEEGEKLAESEPEGEVEEAEKKAEDRFNCLRMMERQ